MECVLFYLYKDVLESLLLMLIPFQGLTTTLYSLIAGLLCRDSLINTVCVEHLLRDQPLYNVLRHPILLIIRFLDNRNQEHNPQLKIAYAIEIRLISVTLMLSTTQPRLRYYYYATDA